MTDATTNTAEETIFVSEQIEELNAICAKAGLTKTKNIKNNNLPSQLKKAVKQFYEDMGIDWEVPFIQAKCNKNGYAGLGFPVFANVGNSPVLIFNSKGLILDLKESLQNNRVNFSIFQTVDNDRIFLKLIYKSPKNPETENFGFTVLLSTEDEAKQKWDALNKKRNKNNTFNPQAVPSRLLADLEYLLVYLGANTFTFNGLKDGEYNVIKIFKRGTSTVGILEDNRQYYFRDFHLEQHNELKNQDKPIVLVISGEQESNGILYKKCWLKGYEPSISVSKAAIKFAEILEQEIRIPALLKEGTDEEKAIAAKPFIIDPPIKMPVISVDRIGTSKFNKSGYLIFVKLGSSTLAINPNSTLEKRIKGHTFDVETFDGVYINVKRLSLLGEHITADIEIEIAQSCLKEEDIAAIDNLFAED
jgi:hypothetical protein